MLITWGPQITLTQFYDQKFMYNNNINNNMTPCLVVFAVLYLEHSFFQNVWSHILQHLFQEVFSLIT